MHLTIAEIEQSLLQFRSARRVIIRELLLGLFSSADIGNPFLLLSRLFVRLKSADSIMEKLRRKQIEIRTADELPERMPDILGLRLIVDTDDEFHAADAHLRRVFRVASCNDYRETPAEYGARGVDYSLKVVIGDRVVPFEAQVKTYLQHYWVTRSFHLFHKQPPDRPRAYADQLRGLADVLQNAEPFSAKLARTASGDDRPSILPARIPGIEDRVHLVAVEPGEQLAKVVVLHLDGDDTTDHQRTVAAKIGLYSEFPGAAVVEASCLGMPTFLLNEPHVLVPLDRVGMVVG
jgi:hypothetical protein